MEVTTISMVKAMLKLVGEVGPPDHEIQVAFIHRWLSIKVLLYNNIKTMAKHASKQ
jgi:hypothetical protein